MAVITRRKGLFAALGVIVLALGVSPLVCTDVGEHSFYVDIYNDERGDVVIRHCRQESCTSFEDSAHLHTGEAYAARATDFDIPIFWQVEDSDGAVLGCIELRFERMEEDVLIPISDAEVCPRAGD